MINTKPIFPIQTRVTYVGNSGILVTINRKKILIDGILNPISTAYRQPAHVMDMISNASAPFDDINLILATHAHRDHFDPERVTEYLAKNPKTSFLSTMDATRQVLMINGTLSNRVYGLSLADGDRTEKVVDGIRLVAYDISHGFNQDGKPLAPNLGYLVEVDGVKIFHPGDWDHEVVKAKDMQSRGIPQEHIDIAFLAHYLLSYRKTLPVALEGIAARYYVAIHYHFTQPAYNPKRMEKVFPGAIRFERELDSWLMPACAGCGGYERAGNPQ